VAVPQRQSALSREFFIVPVEVSVPALANADVTEDVVQFQFVNGGFPPRAWPTPAPNPPATTGWRDGQWVTTPTGLLLAAVLVGPGALELPRAKYAVWIQVVDNPSNPVEPVDTLTIF
jgi:hypothetical protein